jgi:hypothetical protein
LLGVRRFVADQAEPGNAAPFLINRYDGIDVAQIAQVVDQLPELRSALDVAPEKDEPARLNPPKQCRRFRIQFVPGNTSENQLTERRAFHGAHFTFRVELRNKISPLFEY